MANELPRLTSGFKDYTTLSIGVLDFILKGKIQDGTASNVFYALGPGRKGTLWESTAVPEIRVQAAELAELLVEELSFGGKKRLGSGKDVEVGRRWRRVLLLMQE